MNNAVNEDLGANPIHASLIIISALILILRSLQTRSLINSYALLLFFGFLLFCAVFRWQPWGNRLILCLFFLWCPVIATVIFRRIPISITIPVLAIMICFGFHGVWTNSLRPVDPPLFRYYTQAHLLFMLAPKSEYSYTAMMESVKSNHCDKIGLAIGGNTHEYQFWRLMKKYVNHGTIRHVEVANVTKKFEILSPPVCAIISEKELHQISQGEWVKQNYERFSLYLKKE